MRNGTYIKKKPAVMRMITDSSRDTGRNNPSIIQVDGSLKECRGRLILCVSKRGANLTSGFSIDKPPLHKSSSTF